jgi:hypothetical protein
MTSQSISLSLLPGNNPVRVGRGTLLSPTAEWYITGYDMQITTGTVPATGVLVSCDWLHTPLFTLNGVLEPGGIVLAPVSGVYFSTQLCLGEGTVRNSTMNVQVTVLPVDCDAVISRLNINLQGYSK